MSQQNCKIIIMGSRILYYVAMNDEAMNVGIMSDIDDDLLVNRF